MTRLDVIRERNRERKVVIDGKEVYICAGSDTKWLLDRVEELAKLVRGVQWAGSNAVCPWCGSIAGDNNARHYSDCPRQAELAELEK